MSNISLTTKPESNKRKLIKDNQIVKQDNKNTYKHGINNTCLVRSVPTYYNSYSYINGITTFVKTNLYNRSYFQTDEVKLDLADSIPKSIPYNKKMYGEYLPNGHILRVMLNGETSWNSICRGYTQFQTDYLTDLNYVNLKAIQKNNSNLTQTSFFNKYKAPKNAKPVVLNENILKKELDEIIDAEDKSSIMELLEKFNTTVLNCDYEWIIGVTTKGLSPKEARTDWEKKFVYLHQELLNLESSEKILAVIHNHIWGMNLLLSDKDLNLYLNYNVKYGITSNENGMLIMKNTNDKKLSDKDIKNLLKGVNDIDKVIIKKFERDKDIKYYNNNENHEYLLNEYIKDNFDEWIYEYENLFTEYNIYVKYINTKNKILCKVI